MAYKMTKSQTKKLDEYAEELRTIRARMADAATRYNEILEETTAFVQDIASDMQSQYNDASERWQESDKAIAVQDWINQLQDLELTDLEHDEDDDNLTVLEELPRQPDA